MEMAVSCHSEMCQVLDDAIKKVMNSAELFNQEASESQLKRHLTFAIGQKLHTINNSSGSKVAEDVERPQCVCLGRIVKITLHTLTDSFVQASMCPNHTTYTQNETPKVDNSQRSVTLQIGFQPCFQRVGGLRGKSF